jgi:hypothetical protein
MISLVDSCKPAWAHYKLKKEFVLPRLATAAKHYMWFDLAQFHAMHDPGLQSAAAFVSQTLVRRIMCCGVYLVF